MDDQSLAEVDQGEALPDDTQQADPADTSEAVDTAEPQETTPEDDSEEVDYEGSKYRVPKPLKDALLRQSDYTRKTQEVAEQRHALEQQQTAFQQAQQLHQHTMQGRAQLMAVEAQLQQLAQVNLQQLNETDPVRAQQLLIQRQQLHEARQNIAASLSQAEAQALRTQQESHARRIEQAKAVVAREIPDWSDAKAKELYDFAVSRGAPPEQASQIVDPWLVAVLNDAHQFRQLQAKAKPPAKPVAVAKPVSQLPAGKSQVQKSPSDMTDAEFTAWRRRQIAQRRN